MNSRRIISVPDSQGRIATYPIGEDQSGGNGTILQPVSRWRGQPKNTSDLDSDRAFCRRLDFLAAAIKRSISGVVRYSRVRTEEFTGVGGDRPPLTVFHDILPTFQHN
jgi:hypothetical protein